MADYLGLRIKELKVAPRNVLPSISSMRFKIYLKLSVLVSSQLFSILILLSGMVWIDLSCKASYQICDDIEFFGHTVV